MTYHVKELICSYRQVPTTQDYAGDIVSDPDSVVKLANELIGDRSKENFLAFYLDTKNRIASYQVVGVGSTNACPVFVGEIMRGALLCNALAIIVSHNHPSGDPEPSPEDDIITERILSAAKLIDVSLLDHIVVCDGEYYSYAEHGRF